MTNVTHVGWKESNGHIWARSLKPINGWAGSHHAMPHPSQLQSWQQDLPPEHLLGPSESCKTLS